MSLLDIGPEKLLVILTVAFIFLGPKELPAAARKIGAGMRYLRSLQDSFHAELGSALEIPSIEEDETQFGGKGPSSFL